MNATAQPTPTRTGNESAPCGADLTPADHGGHAGGEVDGADPDPPPEHALHHHGPPRVEIVDRSRRRPAVDVAWLSSACTKAVDLLDRSVGRATICLLDDQAMAALHQAHLGIDSTTDVLTFSTSDDDQPLEVDIAVCVDEAVRQTEQRAHDVERELLLYCLHGLLHCCGHDDHAPETFAAMHAAEDRILVAIGVGATFHDAAPRRPRNHGSTTE